jgi:NTE family protein
MVHRKKISLALQGGGSHGAYTWGILERLLEEDKFDIKGICGTSAGAMNGAIATYGLHTKGSQGAIDLLEKFWKRIAQSGAFSPMQASWVDHNLHPGGLDYSFGYQFFNYVTSIFSPYELNPLDVNPIKDILLELINFDELKKSETQLFVSATNVKTCKPKVFNLAEMSVDALLASACLPLMFKAVEINGEFYWDGGYMGNPPIYPLIDANNANDILIVQVNTVIIKEVPKSIKEINDRINEISFNNSLMAEMRMVYFKEKIFNIGYDLRGRLRKIHFHRISADDVLDDLTLSSKFNVAWHFLNDLRQRGRIAADKWLKENAHHVEHKSSFDIRKAYL